MTEPTPARDRSSLVSIAGPVLVVDDDAQLQRTIQWLLEDEGYTVGTASNGEEGLAMAEEMRPSLVILDLNLPALDGEGVAEGLRALHGPDLPIIIVSSDRMLRERARGIGVSASISKPFEVEEFLAAVHRALPPARD